MQADAIMSLFLQICSNPNKQTIHEEIFLSILALLNGTLHLFLSFWVQAIDMWEKQLVRNSVGTCLPLRQFWQAR